MADDTPTDTPDPNTPDPNTDPGKIEFTPEQQSKVNQILAEEKRKNETKYKTLENQYNNLLKNQNLTAQEREALEADLENLHAQFRTKDQQAAAERKKLEEKYKTELQNASGERDTWRQRYEHSTINRELLDAAVQNDAFNSQQIVNLLSSKTKIQEVKDDKGNVTGYEPFVDFDDIDPETEKPVQTRLTPAEAVKRMKELPEMYGNLFKSGVVSGLGQNGATGGHTPGKDGRIDVSKLSQAQFAKLRKENPALLYGK